MNNTELVKYDSEKEECYTKSLTQQVIEAIQEEEEMIHWFNRFRDSFNSKPLRKTLLIK